MKLSLRRASLVASLALLAVACSSEAPADDTGDTTDELSVGHTFDRVALAREYIEGERTLPLEEGGGPNDVPYAERVAKAVARLHPTYVSSLVRHNTPLAGGKDALTADEVHAYAVARHEMPDAKLDVVLSTVNAGKQLSKNEIVDLMKNVEKAIHPDIWFFDFFTDGDPPAVEAAIAYAHSTAGGKKRQLIGGHYFGGISSSHGVDGADFFAVVDDGCGNFDQQKIDDLHKNYKGKPILFHINNNAQNNDTQVCHGVKGTFSCHFMNDFTHAERRAYAEERASHQRSGRYTYMYNAFFPGCPLKTYYDSVHDVGAGGETMLDALVTIANKYD